MASINEELLQFIWRHKLLKPVPLISRAGNTITVLSPGELNPDAGPDFFNAKIRLNDLTLAGNVEIHVRTSDWLKHGHQDDRSYDGLILHAVYEHDTDLDQNTANSVEILELKDLIDGKTLKAYDQLCETKEKLPCADQLNKIPELKFISWTERMTVERLEEKVKRLENYFRSYAGDYTQTFYTSLLRNFGFKVNALPFELLAKQLPVHLLLKHADTLLHLEALLLGMAGLLEDQFSDPYVQKLQNEFEYLKTKYGLKPLQKELFKFSKMRPANFPNLRLVQFAGLVYHNPALLTSPLTFATYPALIKALEIKVQSYWCNHYTMDGTLLEKDLTFGKGSAENLLINTFAPFLFFYSKKLGKPEFTAASIALLTACKPEANSKTRLFESRKKSLRNAADSQGIINLYDNYCSRKQCLKCGIAAAILNPPG